MYYLSAYEGLPYPCRGRQKCGDGKPSPYSSEVIDGLESELVLRCINKRNYV